MHVGGPAIARNSSFFGPGTGGTSHMFASSPKGARAARRARSYQQHRAATSLWARQDAPKKGEGTQVKGTAAAEMAAAKGAPVVGGAPVAQKGDVVVPNADLNDAAVKDSAAGSGADSSSSKGERKEGAGSSSSGYSSNGFPPPGPLSSMPRGPAPPTLYAGSQSPASPTDNVSSGSSETGLRGLPLFAGPAANGGACSKDGSLVPRLALVRTGLRSGPPKPGAAGGFSRSNTVAVDGRVHTPRAGVMSTVAAAAGSEAPPALDHNVDVGTGGRIQGGVNIGSLRRVRGEFRRRGSDENNRGRDSPDSFISDGSRSSTGSAGGRSTGTNDSELSVSGSSDGGSTSTTLAFADRRAALIAASIRTSEPPAPPPPPLIQASAGEGVVARPVARRYQTENRSATEAAKVSHATGTFNRRRRGECGPSVVTPSPERGSPQWQRRAGAEALQRKQSGEASTYKLAVKFPIASSSSSSSTPPSRRPLPASGTSQAAAATAASGSTRLTVVPTVNRLLPEHSSPASTSAASSGETSSGAPMWALTSDSGEEARDLPAPLPARTAVRAAVAAIDGAKLNKSIGGGSARGGTEAGPRRPQSARVNLDAKREQTRDESGDGDDEVSDSEDADGPSKRAFDDLPPAEMGALGVSLACALCGTVETPVKGSGAGRGGARVKAVGGTGGESTVEVEVDVKRCSRCRRGCCDACFRWLPVFCRGPRIVVPGVSACVIMLFFVGGVKSRYSPCFFYFVFVLLC